MVDKKTLRICIDVLCVIFTILSAINYVFSLDMGFKLLMHYSWIVWVICLIIRFYIKRKKYKAKAIWKK